MKQRIWQMLRWSLCLILCLNIVEAKRDGLARLPGAMLLLGYGPTDLQMTMSTQSVRLQPTGNDPTSWGHHVLPSLSRDGNTVASARLKQDGRETIATYVISEKKWTEYVDVDNLWSVSISDDGTKLAFVSDEKGKGALLHIYDTKTGLSSLVVQTPVSVYALPTWSPDGSRIAYQVDLPLRNPHIDHREFAINVVETRTAKTWKIGDGQNPSWSPSGEWIAYLDTSGNPGGGTRCKMVRPDGTDTQVLTTLSRKLWGSRGQFVWAPVWSPDSRKILLNEVANWEAWTMNIGLLDLATKKLVRVGSGPPVLGWAESR